MYPKMYRQYLPSKTYTHYYKWALIKDEHDKESFIRNMPPKTKYETRDLTEDELKEHGLATDYYEHKESPPISIVGNSAPVIFQSEVAFSDTSQIKTTTQQIKAPTAKTNVIKNVGIIIGSILSLLTITRIIFKWPPL